MTLPDPTRAALEQTLAQVRAAKAPLDTAEARLLGLLSQMPIEEEMLGTKVAPGIWGCSENAALKRFRKGLGTKLRDGRWYASRSAVEASFVRMRQGARQDAAG